MLRAFVAQSILHALVAGLVVEALLRAWRVDDAAWRLRFRLLALALPLLVLPALFFVAPLRATPSFVGAPRRSSPASAGTSCRVGGIGPGDLVLPVAAGSGPRSSFATRCPRSSTCCGAARPPRRRPRQPAVPDRRRDGRRPRGRPRCRAAARPRAARAPRPVLLCEGARRPALVVSPPRSRSSMRDARRRASRTRSRTPRTGTPPGATR